MEFIVVPGEDKGKVVLYALSTCGWCKRTKALLNDLGVGYSYVDVDLLGGKDRESALEEVRKWNPNLSFPTVVFGDRECVVGFDEMRIRKALGV